MKRGWQLTLSAVFVCAIPEPRRARLRLDESAILDIRSLETSSVLGRYNSPQGRVAQTDRASDF